jgi:hypothetical protein
MYQQKGRSMGLWIGREYALKYGRDRTSTDTYVHICSCSKMGYFLCIQSAYQLELDPRNEQALSTSLLLRLEKLTT